ALYVDNLKCHVTDASSEDFASWGTELVSLPKSATTVLQPLDVGIMGPFKKRLRALALSYKLSSIQSNQHLPLRKVPAAEKREVVATRVVKTWESISEHCIHREGRSVVTVLNSDTLTRSFTSNRNLPELWLAVNFFVTSLCQTSYQYNI
ncbi:hypothetical protein JG688_00014223, partial [Phytophthora aleatoria]